MNKGINHKKAEKILYRWGVMISGTASGFSSRYNTEGFWIDAESSAKHAIDKNKWPDTDNLNPDLENSLEELGYWSEWQDAGTLILWKTDINDLIKRYEKAFSEAVKRC